MVVRLGPGRLALFGLALLAAACAVRETAGKPPILVVGIDGIDRDLLYEMLREAELPETTRLLGGRKEDDFPHA